MTEPQHTHRVAQIRAELRELAAVVAEHRRDLVSHGMPEPEAFALAQGVEEKWAAVIFDRYEGKAETRALYDVLKMVKEELRRGR